MRILVLIALLFTFTVGSFADMAHASTSDHTCVHHQMTQDNNLDNEDCHSDHSQNECDDCCCIHSHSMAALTFQTKILITVERQDIILSAGQHYSAELSGLKRPPRI